MWIIFQFPLETGPVASAVFEAALLHSYCNGNIQECLWHLVVLNTFSVHPRTHLHPSALQLPSTKLSELPFTLQTACILHYAMFFFCFFVCLFFCINPQPNSVCQIRCPNPNETCRTQSLWLMLDLNRESERRRRCFGITCSSWASSSDEARWDLSILFRVDAHIRNGQ